WSGVTAIRSVPVNGGGCPPWPASSTCASHNSDGDPDRRRRAMRVGVLTGGGDCPGLNAVIRAVVRKAERVYQDEVIGFTDGWRGVLEDRWMPLDIERCRGILPRGGTIIGTSRVQPFMYPDGVDRVRDRKSTRLNSSPVKISYA